MTDRPVAANGNAPSSPFTGGKNHIDEWRAAQGASPIGTEARARGVPGGSPLPRNRPAAARRASGGDGGGGLDALFDAGSPEVTAARLSDRFLLPPFSVLDQRQGYWSSRKRLWLSLGIRSEIGRGADGGPAADGSAFVQKPVGEAARPLTIDSASGRDSTYYAQKNEAERHAGRALTPAEFEADYYIANGDGGGLSSSGTSVFDPVLCELAYRWFSARGSRVLDPFAGGSVRGVVAAMLGRSYTGIDLSEQQITANREQAEQILSPRGVAHPAWIVGDSRDVLDASDERYDLVFSCPPYGSLERYSDDPRDLSAMPDAEFDRVYAEIVQRAVARLHTDRFAVLVVGNYRDRSGAYRDLVGLSVRAMQAAGAAYYNEAVLVTPVGSLPVRAGKQFAASRKLGKTHQNVLVFCKGDGKRAAQHLGAVDTTGLEGEDPQLGLPISVEEADPFADLLS